MKLGTEIYRWKINLYFYTIHIMFDKNKRYYNKKWYFRILAN